MTSLNKCLPEKEIKKIVIFRALQLGDLLCSVPFSRALQQKFQKAKMTLAGLPWAKALVRRFPKYLDSFLEFPGYPGLPDISSDIKRIPDFFKRAATAGLVTFKNARSIILVPKSSN